MKNPKIMRKSNVLTILFVSLSLVFVSFRLPHKAVAATVLADSSVVKDTTSIADSSAIASASLYHSMGLQSIGLAESTFAKAVKGYEMLVDNGVVQNTQYLTIVDMDQNSRSKRFYLIDMVQHEVVMNTFVAHGKNTGVDVAQSFSNAMNSEKSSLGFYVTGNTYTGKHGISLRLSGQEKGFNDNAEKRGVVVHGAPYVNASRVNSGYMGRSQGCPALPENEYSKVISLIKNGSVLFIYHSSEDYLENSGILNS
jgi:hypothetical protein